MKFIADENVGKLCKWLRILGYDVSFYSPIDDAELIRKAAHEDRTILTRDSGIPKWNMAKNCLLLESSSPFEQLKQVVEHFDLSVSKRKIFTRCIECNVPVVEASKPDLKSKIPPYVYKTHDKFAQCPSCKKVYWGGSHYDDVLRRLTDIFEN